MCYFVGPFQRRHRVAHTLEHHSRLCHIAHLFEHYTEFAAKPGLLVPSWFGAAANLYYGHS